MGVADELTQAATTYNPVPSAPSGVFRGGTSELENTDFADLRQDRVQVVTLSSFGGTDSFTLKVRLPDGGYVVTAAFVRGTNAAASDLQTALRTATGDSALAVAGTTDSGPYTITHTKATFRRSFPKYTVSGTGCTGVVTRSQAAGEGDATIGALGESHRVSATNSILKPTIGTITVTAGTDAVQGLDFSGTVSGGTFKLRFKHAVGSDLAYNVSVSDFQDDIQAMFDYLGQPDAAPSVRRRGTNEVQTVTLSSWDGGDTIKVTWGGHESGAITQASDITTDLQTAIDALGALNTTYPDYSPGDIVVSRTNANVYVFTFLAGDVAAKDVTAITFTSGTGSATGAVVETTPGVADGYTFDFSGSADPYKGRPVELLVVEDDSVTGGGSVAIVNTTPGVLGSASIAYTENGSGSDVLAASINDTTGESFGFVKDAATPVVTGSLPPGTYHAVLRTVESGRVSKADTKAFTVTSS